jgi:zinc transporter ZupT
VAAMLEAEVGAILFTAIVAHKGIEVMALATTFKLADFSTKRSMGMVAAFSLLVPAAAFAAVPLIDLMESIEVGFPLALAAGTFLYVGICDLLPEAFHLEKRGYRAFLMIVLGIALMYVISQVAGHMH